MFSKIVIFFVTHDMINKEYIPWRIQMKIKKSPSKINQMNRELFLIAQYHALKTAKYTLSILLLVIITYCMFTQNDSLPAFYILAANHLFPVILRYLIMNNSQAASSLGNSTKKKKEAEQYLLPSMARRYHYSTLEYKTHSMTFLLNCLFLYLWQRRVMHAAAQTILFYVPVGLLAIILVLRVAKTLIVSHRMKVKLLHPNALDN